MPATARPCRDATITVGGNALTGIIDASVALTTDTIETSELSSTVRTYVAGIRSGTASATVFYDQTDTTYAALETAYTAGNTVTLVFTWHSGATYTATALITSLSPSVAMVDICKCSVQFQITGAVTIA